MDFDGLFPSKYVKASDLGGQPRNARIAGLSMEKMGDGEMKPVINFIGATKGLVLNKTNGSVIKELYGPNTGDWRGKTIQLFPSITEFAGKRVDCIRVRAPVIAAAAAVAMHAPAHITEPTGEPERFDDLDDEIPFIWAGALIAPWALALLGMGGVA
jgi:hypothetical protein